MHSQLGVKLELGQFLGTNTLLHIPSLHDLLYRQKDKWPQEYKYKDPPRQFLDSMRSLENRYGTKGQLEYEAYEGHTEKRARAC